MVTRDFQGEVQSECRYGLVQGFPGTSQLSRKGFVAQVHSGMGEWGRQRLSDHVGHSTDSAAGILRQRQLSILRGNQEVQSWITSLSHSNARVTTGKDQTLCSAAEKGLPIITICYGVLVARVSVERARGRQHRPLGTEQGKHTKRATKTPPMQNHDCGVVLVRGNMFRWCICISIYWLI